MKLFELITGGKSSPVGNFNKSAPRSVTAKFMRGGRPLNVNAIDELKDQGVDTVICLLNDKKVYPDSIASVEDEKKAVENAGLNFVSIVMDESRNPSPATVQKFLDTVKGGGKVYVHCSAGKDRVGLMTAIYEVEELGKSYEEAYQHYLEGDHDWETWTNLDKFFYEYCKKKFGDDLHPEKAINAVIKDKADQEWLLDEIVG